jgi:hypothetical protein
VEKNAPISTNDFRTLNRCLDDAIADAVTEFGREQNQSTLDEEIARGSERAGFLAHELRNLLNTAIVAFEVLKRALIGRSLAEVRLTQGIQNREPFLVSEFTSELAPAASLEAHARGIRLTVVPVEDGVAIEADRQVLAGVVGNLLQNAVKFTHPHTAVTLEVSASAERVLIEIQDECGGLPAGTSPNYSARSNSAAPIGPVWALVSPSANGASKRTMVGSMRATCLTGDASSPLTSRGYRFPPSRWCSFGAHAEKHCRKTAELFTLPVAE